MVLKRYITNHKKVALQRAEEWSGKRERGRRVQGLSEDIIVEKLDLQDLSTKKVVEEHPEGKPCRQ